MTDTPTKPPATSAAEIQLRTAEAAIWAWQRGECDAVEAVQRMREAVAEPKPNGCVTAVARHFVRKYGRI